jgi:hypothetical protein
MTDCIQAGIGLFVMTIIGFLSLQKEQRNKNAYMRLGINAAAGLALGLVCLVDTNQMLYKTYIESAWILPTICIARPFKHYHVPHMRRTASKKYVGGEA